MYGEINFSSNTINVKDWDGDVALMGTDKDVVAIFHQGTKFNEVKSREAGTPVFDQMDFLRVLHPGEPLNVYDQPVREQDKYRFRRQWEQYKQGVDQNISGTPLSVLFPWQPEIVETLKHMHIHTVQQLAGLTDTGKQNLMFGQNLSDKAKQYLETAEKGRHYHEMQAQLATRDVQIKELLEKVNELSAKVAAAPRRLGRPPKQKQTEPAAA